MSVGIRHDDLRRRNRAMVIAALRRARQPSRTEIAAMTGLSHSTISAISSDLFSEGVLMESTSGAQALSKRGRPQIALTLDPRAATVVAMVLSLNFLSAAVIDYSGGMVAEEHIKLETLVLPRDALVAACIDMLRRLMPDGPGHGSRQPLRVVFAVQGITDAGARTMLWSPITPHSDIPFADILEKETGIPVTVENDCSMMAIALRGREPDRYRDNFIAILLSHGIGMGLVLKGELFTGTQSSGVEFGHMIHHPDGALCRCRRRGCVEAYAGNYAIWRNAHGKSEESEPENDISDDDMEQLAIRARSGAGRKLEAYRKAGSAIGFSLGNLFALIDPAPVAFVGSGAAALDLLEPHIREAIAKTAGGRHSEAISFDAIVDELPLIRDGCALRALTLVDQEIFGPGILARTDEAGRNVA